MACSSQPLQQIESGFVPLCVQSLNVMRHKAIWYSSTSFLFRPEFFNVRSQKNVSVSKQAFWGVGGGGYNRIQENRSIRECHIWEEQGSFCESFFSVVCVCGPRCDVKWITLGCDENILKITGLDPSIFTSVKKKLKHCFKLTLTLSEKYLSNRPGQMSSPKLSHFSFLPKELGKVSSPIYSWYLLSWHMA